MDLNKSLNFLRNLCRQQTAKVGIKDYRTPSRGAVSNTCQLEDEHMETDSLPEGQNVASSCVCKHWPVKNAPLVEFFM